MKPEPDAPFLDSIPPFAVTVPVTSNVVSNVTASSTFNVPFTVVITPVLAILTTPPPVANEVAPEESKVDTDVSPVTSNVPVTVRSSLTVVSDVVWPILIAVPDVVPIFIEAIPAPLLEASIVSVFAAAELAAMLNDVESVLVIVDVEQFNVKTPLFKSNAPDVVTSISLAFP